MPTLFYGNKLISGGNNKVDGIQVVDTLPTPSASIKNNVYFLATDNHLYKCELDTLTTDYIMVDITAQNGDSELYTDITSNVKIGGINVGTVLSSGTKHNEIFKKMFNETYAPTIKLSINPTQTVYAIGDTISTLDLIATLTKKSLPIKELKYYVNNTLVETKNEITDSTLPTGGSFTYTYNTPITTDTTIKAEVSDGTLTNNDVINIKFVLPMYTGYVRGAMTTVLEEKGNYILKNINCIDDKVIFKYPETYGDLVEILDENGFDNLDSFIKTTETINSVQYNVYTMNDSATLSDFMFTFKFTK